MIRLAVAAGGLAGAVARHTIASLALASPAAPIFPWGTLTVNVAGTVLLGLLIPVLPATAASPAVRAGLTIGFCAGFTTFSTFGFETVALVRAGRTDLAAMYVGASLLLGMAAMLAGLEAGAWLARQRQGVPPTVAPPTAHADRSSNRDAGSRNA